MVKNRFKLSNSGGHMAIEYCTLIVHIKCFYRTFYWHGS